MELPSRDAERSLVQRALEEDGADQDVTSLATVPESTRAKALILAREPGTVAGLRLLAPGGSLTDALGPEVAIELKSRDGASVPAGAPLAILTGPARRLLAFERTVLNFLQRMSGIATLTRQFVEAAGSHGPAILETRKTAPGWRALDKESVRWGGGRNHRQGLHDMILIKENHVTCLGLADRPSAVAESVRRARKAYPELPLEVEVEDLAEFDAALGERPDIILLDGFDDDAVREAVRRRGRSQDAHTLIEVSGGVDLERIKRLRDAGIDRISVGQLTHSPRALDLAIDLAFEDAPS